MVRRNPRTRGMVAVYGKTMMWKTRRDGVRQRYKVSVRFEFKGTRKQLQRAVDMVRREKLVPLTRFMMIGAKAFVSYPGRYARRGRWSLDETGWKMKARRGRARTRYWWR